MVCNGLVIYERRRRKKKEKQANCSGGKAKVAR
jgi:hypothetical protein